MAETIEKDVATADAEQKLKDLFSQSVSGFFSVTAALYAFAKDDPKAPQKLKEWKFGNVAPFGAIFISMVVALTATFALLGVPTYPPFQEAIKISRRYWGADGYVTLLSFLGFSALAALMTYAFCVAMRKAAMENIPASSPLERQSREKQLDHLMAFQVMGIVGVALVIATFYLVAGLALMIPDVQEYLYKEIKLGFWAIPAFFAAPTILGFFYLKWMKKSGLPSNAVNNSFPFAMAFTAFMAIMINQGWQARYAGYQQFLPMVERENAYKQPVVAVAQNCGKKAKIITCAVAVHPDDYQTFEVFGDWTLVKYEYPSMKQTPLPIIWQPATPEGRVLPAAAFDENKYKVVELSAPESTACAKDKPAFERDAAFFYAYGRGPQDRHKVEGRQFTFNLRGDRPHFHELVGKACSAK